MPAKEFYRLRSRAVDKKTALHVGADMFELFLYGLYLAIFSFCMHTILTKRRTTKWPFIAATVVMFCISTTDIVVTMYYLFQFTLNGAAPPSRYPRVLLFITNNVFADAILIHRFYIVYYRDRRLVVPPLLVLLGSSICGYIFAQSTSTRFRMLRPISMWMTFGLNMCLSLLIGGKLFWSGRQARSIIGHEVIFGYYSMSSLIFDSGSVYSIYLLLDLLIESVFLRAGLGQVVGMVPTMIVIRNFVNRRNSLTESTGLHRAAGSSSTPVLDTIFSTVGDIGAPNTASHSPQGSSFQGTLPQEHPVSGTIDF